MKSAIPGLLAQLNLAGAVVTIDAMGCQKNIAKAIIDQQADYVLALKENHPTLHDDIKLWLDDNDAEGYVRMHEIVEKNHGRIETRRTVVSTELDWLAQKEEWAGLQAVAMVESTRENRTPPTNGASGAVRCARSPICPIGKRYSSGQWRQGLHSAIALVTGKRE